MLFNYDKISKLTDGESLRKVLNSERSWKSDYLGIPELALLVSLGAFPDVEQAGEDKFGVWLRFFESVRLCKFCSNGIGLPCSPLKALALSDAGSIMLKCDSPFGSFEIVEIALSLSSLV